MAPVFLCEPAQKICSFLQEEDQKNPKQIDNYKKQVKDITKKLK